MNRLQSELQRLYAIPPLPGADGEAQPTRGLVLELARPADWSELSAVWVGVQADLALPAPAIAINGVDAYQLWFSLAEAAEPAQAQAFLDALCQRYLADIVRRRPQRLRRWPGAEGAPAGALPDLPREQGDSGLWSAFVAPDLAAVFGDEPWLDLPPGIDAQADQLSRLSPIRAADLERALAELQAAAVPAASAPSALTAGPGTTAPAPAASMPASQRADLPVTQDPRAFLLSVMNHPGIDLAWRLDAAKALLRRD